MDSDEPEGAETPEFVYLCFGAKFLLYYVLAVCVVVGAVLLAVVAWDDALVCVAGAFSAGLVMTWFPVRAIKVHGCKVQIINVWGFRRWRGPGAALEGLCLLRRNGLDMDLILSLGLRGSFVLSDTTRRLEPLRAPLKLAGVRGLEPVSERQWRRSLPTRVRVLDWLGALIRWGIIVVVCSLGLFIGYGLLPIWVFVALVVGVPLLIFCVAFVAAGRTIMAEQDQESRATDPSEPDDGEGGPQGTTPTRDP